MADNYLERKMEDYRRGTPSRRKITHSGDTPGTLRIKLTPRPVLLKNVSGEAYELLVGMLAGAGFRIAFTSADMESGRSLAQKVGALLLPDDKADVNFLARHWLVPAASISVPDIRVDEKASPQAFALRAIAEIIDHER